ncbi:MAG: type II/IV secretion system protein [Deltaproteobacteria bacterium]|nr:type II/IV secretion system protein [Deltaproteobacteria bacterium]
MNIEDNSNISEQDIFFDIDCINRFKYLINNLLLTQNQLKEAFADSKKYNKDIETILINDFKIPAKQILCSLSDYFKTPFFSYEKNIKPPAKLFLKTKTEFMKNNLWVPFEQAEKNIKIAINNPKNYQLINSIEAICYEYDIEFYTALKKDILTLIDILEKDTGKDIKNISVVSDKEESEAVKLADEIITEAYNLQASDIHIEPYPEKEKTEIRIRTDGSCRLHKTINSNYRNPLISRIKIMAGLDIAERRKPQDGKIKFKTNQGKNIELRVVTIPTQGGLEDVVLRILPSGDIIPLEDMMFSERNYKKFTQAINKPNGIILVCGPTGSGKTTTLHSALCKINKPDKKIWTAEDPVEITKKGLRQVQVNPKIGFTFAAAMRSFLRADPDVIMVGEMRDKETAKIGIEAALTGHLILSTLHTNNASESIARLLEMGIESFNFADSILIILAQRLAPTLCAACKEKYHPKEKEYINIVKEFGEEDFDNFVDIPYSENFFLYKPVGCGDCAQTGYKGRIAIHELLVGTDKIKRLIKKEAGAEDIRKAAKEDRMTSLRQDGIIKIFKGYCDIKQVKRVSI